MKAVKWNSAEIDFLLYNQDGIIPVEVKANDNTKSKSLKIYVEKYNPKYSIRISTKNFGFTNNIKSIPLYAAFLIKWIDKGGNFFPPLLMLVFYI